MRASAREQAGDFLGQREHVIRQESTGNPRRFRLRRTLPVAYIQGAGHAGQVQ